MPSPSQLGGRPSKFWLKNGPDGGSNAPPSTLLASVEGAAEPIDRTRLERKTSAKKGDVSDVVSCDSTKTLRPSAGNIMGFEARGSEKIAGSGKSSANDSPADNNEPGQAQDGEKRNSHSETEFGASAARNGGSRSRPYSISKESDPAAANRLIDKPVADWTATDVRTWVRALPRGLEAFAEAEAFTNGQVDGKKLATLKLSDIKRKEFRHAMFKAKVWLMPTSRSAFGVRERDRPRLVPCAVCGWHLLHLPRQAVGMEPKLQTDA